MTIRQVAALAKLSLTAEEAERLEGEMEQILQFAQQMQAEASGDDECCINPYDIVLREDVVKPSLPRETLLELAPARTDKYLTVPKAFE